MMDISAYKLFFDAASNSMAVTDYQTGIIVDVNNAWIDSTGLSKEHSLGKTAIELGIWVDASDREKCIKIIQESNQIINFETLLRLKTGENYHLLNARVIEQDSRILILWDFKNIHELKKLNSEITESEVYRKSIFESSHIPIVILDCASHLFLDCNQAAVNIYRYASKADVIGKSPLDVSAKLQYDGQPSDKMATFYINEALKKGSVVFDWLHQRPNGELWDAEVQLLTYTFKDKEYLQFSLFDITERKNAERNLNDKNQEYESLNEELNQIISELNVVKEFLQRTQYSIDNVTDCIFWIDKSANIVFANQSVCNKLGYTMTEILSLTVFDFDPVFPRNKWADHWNEMLEKGSFSIETMHQTKSGKKFPVEVTVNKVIYKDFVYNCAIARDITERKKAESELIHAKQQAVEINERFEYTTSISKIGTWDWDIPSGNLIWSSETFRVLGLEPFSVVPSYELFLSIVHPDDRQLVDNHVKIAWYDHKPYSVDCRIICRNNEIRICNATGKVEYSKSGNPVRMLGTFQDVTERKNIELDLISAKQRAEENEQQILALLANYNLAQSIAKVGNWEWNMVTNEVYWSDGIYEIFELEKGKYIPGFDNNAAFIAPEEIDEYYSLFQKSIETGEQLVHDFRIITSDGKSKFLNTNGRVFYDDQKKPLKFIGTILDITNRKTTENELISAKENAEASENYLRKILDNSPLPVVIAFENQFVEYVNQKFTQIYGYTRDDIPTAEIYFKKAYPDDEYRQKVLGTWLASIDEAIKNHTNVDPQTYTLTTKGGSKKEVEFSMVILGNRAVIVANDITERIRFENEMIEAKEKAEKMAEKLKVTEKQLKLKLDYILSPDVPLENINLTDVVDIEVLQKIQDSFVKATGVASIITDLNGKPITEPSNFSGVCNLIRQTEKGRLNCFNSDKIIGLKAGQEKKPFYAECLSCGFIDAGAPIIIAGKQYAIWMIGQSNIGEVNNDRIENYAKEIGAEPEALLSEYAKMQNMSIQQFEHVTNFLWVMAQELSNLAYNNIQLAKNLEERKIYEKELLIAKDKAEESDRLKTAFLQNMSHEIRTPMNAIMGFSNLLASNYNNKVKLEHFSQIIEQRCNDLLDIINDILDISKIESGQNALNIEECNLNELFRELMAFFKDYQIRTRKHEIILSIDQAINNQILLVKTDKLKLKQVLINLITNAFKYTVKGTISCGYRIDNNKLIFYVSDTGIGIPKDKFDFIFERFAQLNHSTLQNTGGTGLGLSIVKGLVSQLGGKIWLESELDKGTTFFFTIDYLKGDFVEPVEGKSTDHLNELVSEKSVLIVEDDTYNALYLKEVLSNTFTKIHLVDTGMKAIQFVQQNKIDIILMDIRLPDITGYEASKIILQNHPQIKIIAQTAYASVEERAKANSAGCVDYISKPTKREELMDLLWNYV